MTAALVGIALAVGGAPPALAQDGGAGAGTPDPTGAPVTERVSARVLPGIDQLALSTGPGFLVDRATGRSLPLDALAGTCTGFTVTPDGYIGTAGHCADVDTMADWVRLARARAVTRAGGDGDAAYQELQSWVPAADPAGTIPLPLSITVTPATSRPGDPPMPARVVAMRPFERGDVALLKVDARNLMTVSLAPSEPAPVGTPIMTAGYPGARDTRMDPSLDPTWTTGAISSQQARNGIAYTEVSSDIGHGMSGGPTVDLQGRVVGINSQLAEDEGDKFSYVTPVFRLNELVAAQGVVPAAGPADVAFRAGLDDYFGGHYTRARLEFDDVLLVAPRNTAAQDLRDRSARAHQQFGDRDESSTTPWIAVGGGPVLLALVLVALVLLAVVVGLLCWRHRAVARRAPDLRAPDLRAPVIGAPVRSRPIPSGPWPPPRPPGGPRPMVPGPRHPGRRLPDRQVATPRGDDRRLVTARPVGGAPR